MENRTLLYISKILEKGSFSAAAQELFVSQPSLSIFVKNIEKTLGMEIFDRSGRRVTLTEAGEIYLNSEKRIAELMRDREERLLSLQRLRSGKITIGTTPFRSFANLPYVLTVFREKYPQIETVLIENSNYGLEQMVLDGTVDVALCALASRYPSTAFVRLYPEELIFAAAPEHAIVKKMSKTPDKVYYELPAAELPGLSFVVMKQGNHIRDIFLDLCKKLDFEPNITYETGSLNAAYHMAMLSERVTMIPSTLAHVDNISPATLFVLKDMALTRDFGIIYHKERKLSQAAGAFIDCATAYYT